MQLSLELKTQPVITFPTAINHVLCQHVHSSYCSLYMSCVTSEENLFENKENLPLVIIASILMTVLIIYTVKNCQILVKCSWLV